MLLTSDNAASMSVREALHDLRTLQDSCWQRHVTLTRMEQQLPLMTVAERAAYVDELLEFTRAAINGCQEICRSSITLAEQTQAQQAITEDIERALRPWSPDDG